MLKNLSFVTLVMIAIMYAVTDQGYDYNKFVKYMNMSVSERSAADVVEAVEVAKTYGGKFTNGDCIFVDKVDYFKIVKESEKDYFYQICKYENGCFATQIKDSRRDFNIAYNRKDLMTCP